MSGPTPRESGARRAQGQFGQAVDELAHLRRVGRARRRPKGKADSAVAVRAGRPPAAGRPRARRESTGRQRLPAPRIAHTRVDAIPRPEHTHGGAGSLRETRHPLALGDRDRGGGGPPLASGSDGVQRRRVERLPTRVARTGVQRTGRRALLPDGGPHLQRGIPTPLSSSTSWRCHSRSYDRRLQRLRRWPQRTSPLSGSHTSRGGDAFHASSGSPRPLCSHSRRGASSFRGRSGRRISCRSVHPVRPPTPRVAGREEATRRLLAHRDCSRRDADPLLGLDPGTGSRRRTVRRASLGRMAVGRLRRGSGKRSCMHLSSRTTPATSCTSVTHGTHAAPGIFRRFELSAGYMLRTRRRRQAWRF